MTQLWNVYLFSHACQRWCEAEHLKMGFLSLGVNYSLPPGPCALPSAVESTPFPAPYNLPGNHEQVIFWNIFYSSLCRCVVQVSTKTWVTLLRQNAWYDHRSLLYNLHSQRGRWKNCVYYVPKIRHKVLLANILAFTMNMVLTKKSYVNYLINLNDQLMEEVHIHWHFLNEKFDA